MFGQVQREGKDITLVGFGKMVGYNLEAAKELEKEGISAEVGASVLLVQQLCSYEARLASQLIISLISICEGSWPVAC